MSQEFTYGIVLNNVFYSNRIEIKLSNSYPNGIYSMDMNVDDFRSSLAPANIQDAIKYFRKSSNLKVIRGIGFHDGIVPENPISYTQIPIKITDATYDDFDEVEAVVLKNGVCYFLQTLNTVKSYPIIEVKEILEKDGGKIDGVRGVTPDIRIAYMFNIMEVMERKKAEAEEKRKKEMSEPVNYIRSVMEYGGAKVLSVKKVNRGFEVAWESDGYTISTLMDNNYRVIYAGFCVSGYDNTQSASSVVKVLKDYVKREHVTVTRTLHGINRDPHHPRTADNHPYEYDDEDDD